jgi:hypothetical protein
VGAIDAVCAQASRIIGRLTDGTVSADAVLLRAVAPQRAGRHYGRDPSFPARQAKTTLVLHKAAPLRHRTSDVANAVARSALPRRLRSGPTRRLRLPPLARSPRVKRRYGFPSAIRKLRSRLTLATAPAAGMHRRVLTTAASGNAAGYDGRRASNRR